MTSNLDGLNTLYCALWYPVLTHEQIDPLYIPDKIAFIKTKEITINGKTIKKEYPAKIKYNRSIGKDVKGKDDSFEDTDLDIEINNILVSDDEDGEVMIDLLLLEEGFTMSSDGSRIKIRKDRLKANNTDRRTGRNTPLRDIYIIAKYAVGEIQYTDTLLLKCIDARSNGLFLYEYRYLTDDERTEKKLAKRYLLNQNYKITNALYHSIKSFYHSHRYHSSDKDGMILPFCIDKSVCLTEPNNIALLHYLSEFEKIFSDELSEIKKDKEKHDLDCRESLESLVQLRNDEMAIAKTLNQKKSLKKKTKEDNKEIERLQANAFEIENSINACLKKVNRNMYWMSKFLINNCIRSLNIYLYYQTLFYSKYNRQFKLTPEELVSFKIKRSAKNSNITSQDVKLSYQRDNNQIAYKKAINIHNSIETIKLLLTELENETDYYSRFLKHSRLTELAKQTKLISRQNEQIEVLTHKASKDTNFQWKTGLLAGVVSGFLFFCFSLKWPYSLPERDYINLKQNQSHIKERLDSLSDQETKYRITLEDSIQVLNEKLKKVSLLPSPTKVKNSSSK